jgi:hypothetical protein
MQGLKNPEPLQKMSARHPNERIASGSLPGQVKIYKRSVACQAEKPLAKIKTTVFWLLAVKALFS